ncbi:LysR family transcriptional regulator [uncultured Cohaesibacter sp.]|uniref:LysR family transcriptional regulator n=1 Tax=uncultured Cohaesibacter sp. TaxID=1002546 RepID=UPI002930B7E5|nr:LysR family transcriptional regulator [uncultured Cohaesibacter sp.]
MRHLQSFKYVKSIAEAGSIRGAAETLAISPSALNRHIQTLEMDLGIQIFDRLTKGVRLSVEGELFYRYAQKQLAGFEKLQSQISDIKGLRTGTVRIGISGDLGHKFIHKQIAEYQNDHPQVSFTLKVIAQKDLEAALKSNHIDVALFYQPVLTRNLQVIHAIETQIFAALPNGAPTRQKNALLLYELIDHAIVMPPRDTELRIKIDSACEKIGIELRNLLECADPLPHLSATMNARIAFCLPFREDFEEFAMRGYKLVPITSSELLTGFINIVCAAQSLTSIAAQKFVERLIVSLEERRARPF